MWTLQASILKTLNDLKRHASNNRDPPGAIVAGATITEAEVVPSLKDMNTLSEMKPASRQYQLSSNGHLPLLMP